MTAVTHDHDSGRGSAFALGSLIVALNIYDALVSRVLVTRGGSEGNPLMALIIDTPWFYVVKVVIPLTAVIVNLRYGEHQRTRRQFAVIVAIFAAVCIWNTSLLWKYPG